MRLPTQPRISTAEDGKPILPLNLNPNQNKRMKTILQLNIGLNDNSNQPVNIHTVCTTLTAHGFNILASRAFPSPAGNEDCLSLAVQFSGSEVDCNARLYCVASCLRQDCIAVMNGGKGELIGPQSEKWGEFNPAFFVGLSGLTLAEVETPTTNPVDEDCRIDIGALPSQHSRDEYNGFTRQEFLNYLEFSIIPDSIASGHEGYASDLQTALYFLRNK
jgi:hypothetical protein